jgi:ferritin-like metal-binding protein YciE
MTLHEMLVDELRDLYHAEKQLTKALPKLAKAATHDGLRDAFESHLEETRGHVSRLEEAFAALDEPAKAKRCAGMAGIIEEGSDLLSEDAEGAVMDAALIAAGQRAEHYEMAAYGTCIAWATQLGLDEVVSLLEQTLDEEKAADQKLSSLAEDEINAAAVAQDQESDDEEGEEQETPTRATRTTAASQRGRAASAERRQSSGGTRTRAKAADRRRS